MNYRYFPVLPSKLGECTALRNLGSDVKTAIKPIVEIPPLPKNKEYWSKKLLSSTAPIQTHIHDSVRKFSEVWTKPCFYDIGAWLPNDQAENGSNVLLQIAHEIGLAGGQNLSCPVVRMDMWDDPDYKVAIKALAPRIKTDPVIRFDHVSTSDLSDEDFILEVLSGMAEDLSISLRETTIFFDFASMVGTSIAEALARIEEGIELMARAGVRSFIVGGSSMPATVNDAVEHHDQDGLVVRREMTLFQLAATQHYHLDIGFADYGIRSPAAPTEGVFPHQNGKIRYTVAGSYFIARGHSLRQGNRFHQFFDLAERIVNSRHYLGDHLSWGDEQLQSKALHLGGTGNATSWVAIDTCHHLTLVSSEVDQVMEEVEEARTSAHDIPIA